MTRQAGSQSFGNGRIWRRKQARGSIWVGDWKDAAGKRHRKALSSDKRIAERLFTDILRKRDLCAAGLGIEEGFDLLIEELLDEFLVDLRARRSARYADRAESCIRRVIRETGAKRVRDLQPRSFLAYRQMRLRDGRANRTVNMELVTTRTFLNWAVRTGYIAYNPLQGVQPLPQGRGYERSPRRPLDEDEVVRFVAAAQQVDRESAEHAAATKTIEGGTKGQHWAKRERRAVVPQSPLWLTLLELGSRFGETVQTTWGDLSEKGGVLTLRASTTKSRKERRVPVRRELVEELVRLRRAHHEVLGRIPTAGDHIFLTPLGTPWCTKRQNAMKRFKHILEAAGIQKVNEQGEKLDIHSLRYTAASRFARSGVGLVQAQKILGHSDPKLTSAIYTHLDAEDLREAVEGLPSLRVVNG